MIALLNFASAQTASLQKALQSADISHRLIDAPADLEGAQKLIIPHARSFSRLVAAIRDKGLVGPLIRRLEAGLPTLAIGAGLHLLFDVSHEEHQHVGLGVIHGKVAHFDFGNHPAARHFKAPHQGWNQVHAAVDQPIMQGIDRASYFYFDHVAHAEPLDIRMIAARTNHGVDFASMIRRESIYGVEFLPEKSDQAGVQLLANFASL